MTNRESKGGLFFDILENAGVTVPDDNALNNLVLDSINYVNVLLSVESILGIDLTEENVNQFHDLSKLKAFIDEFTDETE